MKAILYWCAISGSVLLAALFFRFVQHAHMIFIGLILTLTCGLIWFITRR